jgi:hypothetical protein
VTIFLKRSFLIARAERAVIAWAVEKLGFVGSPELLFHCWFRFNSFENAFILLIKV